MKQVIRGLVFVLVVIVLAGCSRAALPSEAKTAVLRGFGPDMDVRIDSAQQVELLAEDLAMDAEEVWCVTVTYRCWICDYGEFRTCGDNRLARRIDDTWDISLVTTPQEEGRWEARGCTLLSPVVGSSTQ